MTMQMKKFHDYVVINFQQCVCIPLIQPCLVRVNTDYRNILYFMSLIVYQVKASDAREYVSANSLPPQT